MLKKDWRQETFLPCSNSYQHFVGKGQKDALNAIFKALKNMGYNIPKSIIIKSILDYNSIEQAINDGLFDNYVENPRELISKDIDEATQMIKNLAYAKENQKWEFKLGCSNTFASMYDSKDNMKGELKHMKKRKHDFRKTYKGNVEGESPTKTSQGYDILGSYIGEDRRMYVIVKQNTGYYVVGIGYDIDDGTWGQGVYDFETFEKAKDYIDKKYGIVRTTREVKVTDSKGKGAKTKDTFRGDEIINDLFDRVVGWVKDGVDDDGAIEKSIDDGLIYYSDIIDLAEHYGVIDYADLVTKFYDDLYADLSNKLEEYKGSKTGDSKKRERDVRTTLHGSKCDSKAKKGIKRDSIHTEIEEDEAVEMLMNRLGNWTSDDHALDLFSKYYEDLVYGGAFDGVKFNVREIVDNDWVNNTAIIEKGDDDEARNWDFESYDDLVKQWKNGDTDIVLAESDGDFLISTY
jgi:hypothetical protein